MTSVRIDIPTEIPEIEVKMLVAGNLFESGRLTAGQAAQMVGVTKETFLELLGKYGFSPFGYSLEELNQELTQVKGWVK